MQLLIILLGFLSVANVAIFVLAIAIGLCLTRRFRSAGVVVLLVPTMSAATAFVGSWGLAFLSDSVAKTAGSHEASQQYRYGSDPAWWASACCL